MADEEKSAEKPGQPALVNITDVIGLGASSKALIAAIERGVGWLGGLAKINIEGRQRRHEVQRWAKSLGEVGLSPDRAELTLGERTELRVSLDAARHQENREAIAAHAAHEFKSMPKDSSAPHSATDPEWVDRFWRLAQEISREDLQALWGRLLARQVTAKHRFSPRSLEALALLTHEEMTAIEGIAATVWWVDLDTDSRQAGVLHQISQKPYGFNSFDGLVVKRSELAAKEFKSHIDFSKIETLREIGIFAPEAWDDYFEPAYPRQRDAVFMIGSKAFSLNGVYGGHRHENAPSKRGAFRLGKAEKLTKLGMEIVELVHAEPTDSYMNALNTLLGFTVFEIAPR